MGTDKQINIGVIHQKKPIKIFVTVTTNRIGLELFKLIFLLKDVTL